MKNKIVSASLAVNLMAGATVAGAAAPEILDARASDPIRLGWMVGSPPPPERMIRYEDGSFYRFPQWRWSFSHWRELHPTVNVPRGSGPAHALPRAERSDLDAVTFTPIGGDAPMTWAQSLEANYTDGIIVLHRGCIVYERYFGALTAERPHIAFSVTKSFFGTIGAMLVAEGVLDADATVAKYIPELAQGGWGDATVQQVLDMTTAVDFVENYTDDSPTMRAYLAATSRMAREAHEPQGLYAYLPAVGKQGKHGEVFTYRTPNTDVVGWLISRATGKPLATVLSERIWSRIGAEEDAHIVVDRAGTPLIGSSLNARLRDFARFGEAMRLRGRFDDQQIIPVGVIDDIRRGGNREAFAKASYPTLPGWSYRNQWWASHDDRDAFMARGIHGQAIYIDPKAEMVIARFASHPKAGNVNLDPTSLPAYRAIAEHLMRVSK